MESYDLTLTHLDRTGAATDRYYSVLLGLDEARFERPYDPDGTATLRLPKGRYGLSAVIDTPRATGWYDSALLAQPEFVLAADTTVVLDGRAAKTRRPHRCPRSRPCRRWSTSGSPTSPGSAPSGSTCSARRRRGCSAPGWVRPYSARAFVAAVGGQWARPGPDGRFDNTPYLYATSELIAGRLPTGLVRHYRPRDLATVRHEFGAGSAGQSAERYVYPLYGKDAGGWAVILPAALPGERVEHYSTASGVRWTSELDLGGRDPDGWLTLQAVLLSSPRRYPAGRIGSERWNAGPYGPAFPAAVSPANWVTRYGDEIIVAAPLFSDRGGHAGFALTGTGRTALYREGVLVAATTQAGFGQFEVPGGSAAYRLEATGTRRGVELATLVSAAWTFTSGRAATDGFARLPILAVRFTPSSAPVARRPPGGASTSR